MAQKPWLGSVAALVAALTVIASLSTVTGLQTDEFDELSVSKGSKPDVDHWLEVYEAALSLDHSSDEEYYGNFELKDSADDTDAKPVSLEEVEGKFFKSMEAMAKEDDHSDWVSPDTCSPDEEYINQFQRYNLEDISRLAKEASRMSQVKKRELAQLLGATAGEGKNTHSKLHPFFTLKMALSVITTGKADDKDTQMIINALIEAKCISEGTFAGEDVDDLRKDVKKNADECHFDFLFRLAGEFITQPEKKNPALAVARVVCEFVTEIVDYSACNLDSLLALAGAEDIPEEHQWAFGVVEALSDAADMLPPPKKDTPEVAARNLAYADSWKNYKRVVPDIILRVVNEAGGGSDEAIPEIEGETYPSVEHARALCKLPPGDVQYKALCTNPKTHQLSWDWCRDVLYLRKDLVSGECMGSLIQYRGELVDSMLNAAIAYSHQNFEEFVKEADEKGHHHDDTTEDQFMHALEEPGTSEMDPVLTPLFLMSGAGETLPVDKVIKNLYHEKMDESLVKDLVDQLETFTDELPKKEKCQFRETARDDKDRDPDQLVFPRIKCISPGSTDPTSDIDMPCGGPFAEDVVKIFYFLFSKRFGCVESSTAMDVNIYASDGDMYIQRRKERFSTSGRGAVAWSMFRGEDIYLKRLDYFTSEQDSASLVSLRRVIDEETWSEFKAMVIDGINELHEAPEDVTNHAEVEEGFIERVVEEFEERAQWAEERFARLEGALNEKICELGDKKDCDDEEIEELSEHSPDLPNKAMNRLYEEKLEDFKAKHLVFDRAVARLASGLPFDKDPAKEVRLDKTEAENQVFAVDKTFQLLSSKFIDVGYYAAEAYITGGALVHVVGNIQAKQNFPLMPEQLLQSLNEQFGMLLHGFKHIWHQEQEGLRLGKALFKTGKYLDRMANAYTDIVNIITEGDEKPETSIPGKELIALGDKLVKIKKTTYKEKVLHHRGYESQMLLKEFFGKIKVDECELAKMMYGSHVECTDGHVEHHDEASELNYEDAIKKAFIGVLMKFVAEVNVIARVRGVGASRVLLGRFDDKETEHDEIPHSEIQYEKLYMAHYDKMRELYEAESKKKKLPMNKDPITPAKLVELSEARNTGRMFKGCSEALDDDLELAELPQGQEAARSTPSVGLRANKKTTSKK